MALGKEWEWFNADKKLATTETALGGIPLGWNCHLSLSESCFLRVPNGSHSFPEKVVLKKRQNTYVRSTHGKIQAATISGKGMPANLLSEAIQKFTFLCLTSCNVRH